MDGNAQDKLGFLDSHDLARWHDLAGVRGRLCYLAPLPGGVRSQSTNSHGEVKESVARH